MDEKTRRFKRVEKLFSPEPDLVAVEELADLITSRPVRSRIRERLRPEPGAPAPPEIIPDVKLPTIKTVDKIVHPVPRTLDIIEASSPGLLHEVTLRSPSNNFSLLIKADGKKKLDRTYAQMAVLSPYSTTIDAFQEHDTLIYTVHIQKMDWKFSFLFKLYADNPITFENIWAHWTVIE